jgi:hypothetical protein
MLESNFWWNSNWIDNDCNYEFDLEIKWYYVLITNMYKGGNKLL